MLLWWPAFKQCDYNDRDFDDALERITAEPKRLSNDAKYAGKLAAHLAAIHQAIHECRIVERAEETKQMSHDFGQCVICSGSGWAIVPHLNTIRDGEWRPIGTGLKTGTYYTMAVACKCSLARWREKQEADRQSELPMHKKTPPRINLEQYEAENPDWQRQIEARKAQGREKSKLSAGAKKTELDAVLARLAKRNKEQKESA